MGEKKMCPRKSVALFIVWIVSFLGLNAVSAYRNIYQALHEAQQVSRIEPDGFLLLLLFLVGIYIIPMLFVVYHYAKAEQVKSEKGQYTVHIIILQWIVLWGPVC